MPAFSKLLASAAVIPDKLDEQPAVRAFFRKDDALALCIANEKGDFKTVLFMVVKDGSISHVYFSKGEPFNFDNWSLITKSDLLNIELRLKEQTSKITFTCCEVCFALKGMLTVTGIQRILDSKDEAKIKDLCIVLQKEGKYTNPNGLSDQEYLEDTINQEWKKMMTVISTGNPEKMKKAARDYSGVFLFPSKDGLVDLRFEQIPWHQIACTLLFHIKLRLWLQDPVMRWFLCNFFHSAVIREASPSDALYGVILSKAPKPSGTSPVDPIAGGGPTAEAAAAVSAAVDDDDWSDLDDRKGSLLGRTNRAAIHSLKSGRLNESFGVAADKMHSMGFGPLLLTVDDFSRLYLENEAATQEVGKEVRAAIAGSKGGVLDDFVAALTAAGVQQISQEDLAFCKAGAHIAPISQ